MRDSICLNSQTGLNRLKSNQNEPQKILFSIVQVYPARNLPEKLDVRVQCPKQVTEVTQQWLPTFF